MANGPKTTNNRNSTLKTNYSSVNPDLYASIFCGQALIVCGEVTKNLLVPIQNQY